MRIIDKLKQHLRDTADYNPEVQVAPACILWPDKERQWESVIPRIQAEMPELFILGEYDPERSTGPGIWLRCVIARILEGISLPEDRIPVIYLPGVGRQDLRAVESCPDYLKPVVELQYRGAVWTQHNTKDWTVLAFFVSTKGGLGLDVARDRATLNAMQVALYQVLDKEYDLLAGRHLDQNFFNNLLTGGDPVKDLLQWLDQGEVFKQSRSGNEWQAFVSVCRSQMGFNPEKEGVIAGAQKLAERKGPWQSVWDRFCEAPQRYQRIPERLRQTKMKQVTLFADEDSHGGWPQWNERQEGQLRDALATLERKTPSEAQAKILELEKSHGGRRHFVWADLDETQLADALQWLAVLAEKTQSALAGGSMEDIVSGYIHSGWLADDAALRALASVRDQADAAVVITAIRTIYLPWLDESNRNLQKLAEQDGYPGKEEAAQILPKYKKGECVLFVDGLRFDIARRLINRLENKGYGVDQVRRLAPLPSVTATGKPAVSPVRDRIAGKNSNSDFEPVVAESGQSLKGGYQLKKLLGEEGWTVLDKKGSGQGETGWCECGDIDSEGHKSGWKIVRYIANILSEITEEVESLMQAGWTRVRLVTDHGWLLMPGGLPKVDLPLALTENKWGRCAVLKPGVKSQEKQFLWYWNENQPVALAGGISCYREGMEYSHGGLSLQECLLLDLTVTGGINKGRSIEITDTVWRGLRCKLAIDGDYQGLSVDIRLQAGKAESRVAMDRKTKPVDQSGKASVVVEDDALEGREAFVVVIDEDGDLVTQLQTVIGGGE